MAFLNKGRSMKAGDRVNIAIGQFRANGLVVNYPSPFIRTIIFQLTL